MEVDPAFYHTLRRYTLFSAAGLVVDLTGACPTPPDGSALLQIISNTTTSTAVSIFRADTTKEIIASFPGTDSLQDFLTDFTFFPVDYACAGCQVHSGFYNAYQSIAPALTSALTGYVAQYPGYTVTITGHSLGGALAGLAYPDLKFTTALPVHKAYTFGQPRVGNAAFASFVDALSQSTQNTTGNYIRTTHFYGNKAAPHVRLERHPDLNSRRCPPATRPADGLPPFTNRILRARRELYVQFPGCGAHVSLFRPGGRRLQRSVWHSGHQQCPYLLQRRHDDWLNGLFRRDFLAAGGRLLY